MTPAELLYAVETEIILDISRLLGGGHVATADWKLEKLRKLGGLTDRAGAIIRNYRDKIVSGTATEIDRAAMASLLKNEDLYKKARKDGATLADALPLDADPAIKQTIATWQKAAESQMNLAMTKLLENSGQVYVDTINRVTSETISGAMSGKEALVRAVREWSSSGIPSIVDKAGRHWTTEAYANMVVRSNVRRVTTEVQFERAKEYGSDLIEVSAHAGARELCEPYQGRIFSLSGRSEKYPAFSTTSYGEPAGLFGINCGHTQYPFFEGISKKTFEPTQDKEENDRIYEESQKQRALERGIRSAKRELDAMKAIGDQGGIAKAKALLADRQGMMRDFIETTGRTRYRGREQVYDPPPAPKIVQIPSLPSPTSSAPIQPAALTDTFVPARTVAEAHSWAEANLGIKKNTSSLNVEALNAIHAEFFNLKKDWDFHVGWIDNTNQPYAAANHFRMRFHSGYFNDQEKLQKSFDRDVLVKFHPSGEGSALKAIVDHEFAHTLTAMDIRGIGEHPEVRDAVIRLKSAYTRSVNRGGEIISRYAAENSHEFVAESFSMVLNSKNPHPIAVEVFGLLKEYYGRKN